jgi:Uma2 family endonuclease
MEDAAILEAVADSPNAYQLVAQMQALLDREKEERRKFHELVHDDMKAEFINGEIIMQSPVRREHWRTSSRLSKSLMVHVDDNELGEVGIEKVMISLTRNDYEPDIVFFGKDKVAHMFPGQLLYPAPDFIVEILSKTTEKYDRTIKLQDYAAHGITEYWIIDPVKQSVEQYWLENGSYRLQAKLVKEGILHAKAVMGYQVKLEEIF